MEKIRIRKKVPDVNLDFLEDYVSDVIIKLESITKDLQKEGWTELEIEKYYDLYDESLELFGVNFENDEEFKERTLCEMRRKQESDEILLKEKQEYLRLKQKFGDDLFNLI